MFFSLTIVAALSPPAPPQQRLRSLSSNSSPIILRTTKPVHNLPDGPSAGIVAFLWFNTALMLPAGAVGLWCGLPVLGTQFSIDKQSALVAMAFTAFWVTLSSLPLQKVFPRKLGFLKDINAHSELLTATAFGVERGGLGRSLMVLASVVLLSLSAGVFEEIAFRGFAQTGVATLLGFLIPSAGLATAIAIVATSAAFGMVHNYCKGYSFLATLAGVFFGTAFALTNNLFVAAFTHAAVDLFAFIISYVCLVRATPDYKYKLAQKDFPITNTLRDTRLFLDQWWARRNWRPMTAMRAFLNKRRGTPGFKQQPDAPPIVAIPNLTPYQQPYFPPSPPPQV